jgi:phosphoribosyl-AMP cyclohydrolase
LHFYKISLSSPPILAGFSFEQRGNFVSDSLDFNKQDGLITAVVQDASSHRVLMVGYMNREAFEKTISTGNVTFFSRSRQKLWIKGETSGHFLKLKSIHTDCDSDALLVEAQPIGPGVCHNGFESCFYRTWQDGQWLETEKPVYDTTSVYGTTK